MPKQMWHSRIFRKMSTVTLAAALVGALAACAPAAKIPAPKTAGIAEPIISEKNFEKILTETKKNLAAADQAVDLQQLGGRVAGVMRAQREAQYRLKQILGEKYNLPVVIVETNAAPITAGTDFPRIAGSVNQPQQPQNFQTLSIWAQENPRAQYALWGQTSLFPGVKIPKIKANLSDVQSIQAPEKYVAAPEKVLPSYSTYLTAGTQGELTFSAADPIFTQIQAQRTQLTEALGELAGVEISATPAEFGAKMVPTEDGGALVTGAIDYSVIVTRNQADATLRLKGEIGALATGDAQNAQVAVNQKLSAKYLILATFYLPPHDATEKTVQVIGATAPVLVAVVNEE